MVSVIVPSYNYASYLSKCIDSVLAQSFEDFEIIVIDDASEDDTQELLKDYTRRDRRIKSIRNEQNLGLRRSQNIGIKRAQGEYIACLDADDRWYPDFLKKTTRILDDYPDVNLVYTKYDLIDEEGSIIGEYISNFFPHRRDYIGDDLINIVSRWNFISTSATIFRKKSAFEVGLFDERLKHTGDWYLWTKLAGCGKTAFLNEVLSSLRIHPHKMSSTMDITIRESEELQMRKRLLTDPEFYILKPLENKIYGYGYLQIATYYWETGNFKDFRERMKRALKYHLPIILEPHPNILRYILSFIFNTNSTECIVKSLTNIVRKGITI